MKSFLSKKFSIALSTTFACCTPFAFSSLTSCSASSQIQFANFESYMDDGLMNYLQDTYGTQFQWYTVTEMIETKFHDTYDIAIPSGYELSVLQKKGWLQKLDWSKFGIPNVSNPDEAMSLFAPEIQKAITQMNTELGMNVLEYGVPYFAQSFSFVYKGNPIQFYKNGTTDTTQNPTWSDIFYTISPQNPNLDPRFRDRRIGMLDDPKSIYDVARIMETSEANPDNPNLWTNRMPEGATINDLVETFKSLTNKAERNWYTLNTDSGIISRNLSDHSEKSYVSALTWSGDALYAAQGAGEFDAYKGNEMHIQKPAGVSLDEIEYIVINNKNANDTVKLDKMYKLIYDICLDAWNVKREEDLFNIVEDRYGSRYKYWSVQNWDTVSYTPILNSIYSMTTNPNSSYWDAFAEKEDLETRELFTSILKVTDVRSEFGKPLSSLENSNTHWAWLQTRGNL